MEVILLRRMIGSVTESLSMAVEDPRLRGGSKGIPKGCIRRTVCSRQTRTVHGEESNVTLSSDSRTVYTCFSTQAW